MSLSILLTIRDELAERLMHPRFDVKKVYHVKPSACPPARVSGRIC